MKTLFENKKNKIKYNRLLKSMLISVPISALIFSFFKSFLSWTKPEIKEILIFILILGILKLGEALIHNYRNHLESITLDYENEKIMFSHVVLSKENTKTTMELKEIKISEIKHVPVSWFSFINYFWISDEKSKIKISTAGHENKDIILNKIHSELKNIQQNV
ncbi:hypothetical protein [uncultured Tenacibaculum sp.]|uniref:hypothetical protein n=1 Tax=uncultured Tenacibaculum sp. TaxID=174713 RepID=UPI00262B163A|nr:hypothetical protein [uncultured Tenacibaculum sp.]